jgi:hypothetical protein
MSWRELPGHWLHRIDEAVLSVAEEFAKEYLEDVEEWADDDGTPYDSRRPDEIVRETLELHESWIEARLSGLDSSVLGASRSEVLAGVGQVWRMDDWLDIALTRSFLDGLEEMRERLVSIPAMLLAPELPEEIRVYVVQTTRCFVLGLREAAGVLARTALEKGLQDRLGHGGLLKDLIPEARTSGLLAGPDFDVARRIQDIGNKAAHGKKLSAAEAQFAATEIRKLVGRLYLVP